MLELWSTFSQKDIADTVQDTFCEKVLQTVLFPKKGLQHLVPVVSLSVLFNPPFRHAPNKYCSFGFL